MNNPVVILGCGGHASVLLDMVDRERSEVIGWVGPNSDCTRAPFKNIRYLGDDSSFCAKSNSQIALINGLGFLPKSRLRSDVFDNYFQSGFVFLTLSSGNAVISGGSVLENGVQVMPNAVVNSGARVGRNSIVNTGAIVEHDCRIGRHNHLAPGSTVCGGVITGENVYVGAGATIIQGCTIGTNAIIGANALVSKDVPDNAIVYGAKSHIV